MPAHLLNSKDPIVGGLLETAAFSGWWAIFWFLGLATLIFICAKKMSDYVEEISVRGTLSNAFIGGVVLTIVTSIPETIAAIFGGINNEVTFPIYNELGSNMISTVVVAFLLIATYLHVMRQNKLHPQNKIRKDDLSHIGRSNIILTRLVLVVNICLFLFVVVDPIGLNLTINGVRMSVMAFIPIAMFCWFVFWSYRHKDRGDEKDAFAVTRYGHMKIGKVWTIFVLIAVALIALAYLNANVVESFSDPHVLGIPESSAAGIFLSLSDGMPELVTTIFLMWRGHTSIAFGAVVGSHLFNYSQMFFTDAISVQGNGTFEVVRGYINSYADPNYVANPLTHSEVLAAHQLQGFVGLALLLSLILNLYTFKKFSRNPRLSLTGAGATIASYGTGFALCTTLL